MLRMPAMRSCRSGRCKSRLDAVCLSCRGGGPKRASYSTWRMGPVVYPLVRAMSAPPTRHAARRPTRAAEGPVVVGSAGQAVESTEAADGLPR